MSPLHRIVRHRRLQARIARACFASSDEEWNDEEVDYEGGQDGREDPGYGMTILPEVASIETDPNVLPQIDGPYGGIRHKLARHDRLLLFAGGSGITFTIPLLMAAIQDCGNIKRVDLIWAVPNEGESTIYYGAIAFESLVDTVQIVWSGSNLSLT